MDLKSIVSIEVQKGDKKFSFHMPVGAAFGEAYDAAYEIIQQVVTLSKQSADDLKKKEENQVDTPQ